MNIVSSKPTITRKELEGVLDCLISQKLKDGDAAKNFEQHIASLVDVKYSLATNSLVSAYHLAFLALNLHNGDEVIIPSFFETAPLVALRLVGGHPVLVDSEEGSLFPSMEQVRQKITERTKAIICGHMLGFHGSCAGVQDLHIPVIEDISHAMGSEHNERPAGNLGIITVASFAPTMIITTGNGGMVLTNNSRFFSTMREMRGGDSGENAPGFDYTITDFQGAMGVSQVIKLQDFLKRRREIARRYYDALKTTPHSSPYAFADSFAYQSFPVLFDAPAEKVEKYWKKCGIEIFRPLPRALHSFLDLRPMDYPNSDRLAKKLYSLPIYPTLSRKEIEKIAASLAKFV
jgi:dTDP-4-amino-4,6-dideoxygalactose transaminase